MNETKYTKGPWRWEINPNGRQIQLCGGKPEYDLTVMDFVRWGMNGAQPRVLTKNGRGMELLEKAENFKAIAPNREHHASWFQVLKHPDLDLIAAAPELLEALSMAFESILKYDPRDPVLAHIHTALGKAEGRL